MADPSLDAVAGLRLANAELADARKAALILMEDAILARDALRASEERQAFLLRLSDAIRPLADPVAVKVAASRVLGEHLGVNRAFYAEVEGNDWIVVRGYEQGVAPLADGPYSADTYGHWVMQTYREGRRIIFRDTRSDPRFAASERDTHVASAIIGAVGVPLMKEGRLVAILAVHTAGPRDWDEAEVNLVEETAERTWASVERARAEAALRASEEQFRRAIEEAPIPVIMQAEDGQVLQISTTWTDLTGYTLEDVPTAGAWLTRAYGPGADAVRSHMHELFKGDRKTLDVDFTLRTKGGADRHWSFSASAPGALRDGRRFLVGMAVDVTDRERAGHDLRRSEERQRLIVESATEHAIFTVAEDHTVTSWSPGAVVVFGYSADEIIGQSADLLFTPEDRALGAPEHEMEMARRDGRAADERWHLRKDGTRFFASGVLNLLRDGGGFVKVARDLTHRKLMEEDLERRVAARTAELAMVVEVLEAEMGRRRELARRLGSAQEGERRRVARDLHDTLGQLQAGLGMAVAAARRAPDLPAAAAERLAEVQRLVGELTRETHALAVRLRPTALDDLGLEPALRQLVSDWFASGGVAVDFQLAGLDDDRLPPEIETAIYRVVQEALTNVTRHAHASQVGVAIVRTDDDVTATVEDDGVGFEPTNSGAGRLGLVGMRERVELAGGTLQVESEAGTGTTVIVRFPLGCSPDE